MADIIKVDTAKVKGTASDIAHYNNKISDDFAEVESAIKSLDSSWNSSVASSGISAFHDIKNAYYEARYNVVNNYVSFLHKQVDPSYNQTETKNQSLADAFKS